MTYHILVVIFFLANGKCPQSMSEARPQNIGNYQIGWYVTVYQLALEHRIPPQYSQDYFIILVDMVCFLGQFGGIT